MNNTSVQFILMILKNIEAKIRLSQFMLYTENWMLLLGNKCYKHKMILKELG